MCWTKKWGKSHHLTRRQLGKLDACMLNSFSQDTEKRKVDRWTSWKLHTEGNLFFHQVSSYALLFQKETPKCWCVLRKNREFCFFHFSSQVWLPNEKGFTKILAIKTRFTFRLFNSTTQCFCFFHFSLQVLTYKWEGVHKSLSPRNSIRIQTFFTSEMKHRDSLPIRTFFTSKM